MREWLGRLGWVDELGQSCRFSKHTTETHAQISSTCRTFDDIAQNAATFAKDLQNHEIGPRLQATLSLTHHWYAFKDEAGYHFVSSKFAGYKDMTGRIYLACYSLPKAEGGLHGSVTEDNLPELTTVIDEDDENMAEYGLQLAQWLGLTFGKRRRKNSTISVLKGSA